MSAEEKKTKQKSKEYPAVTLEQAIDFTRRFKDYPKSKPISYETAAKECGVSVGTKSFRYTISSAKQFGLLSTSTGLTFTLLEPAYRLIRPTESDSVIKALKTECFSSPKLYASLINNYLGKSLPPVGTLENLLVNSYQIAPAVAKGAAQRFIESATELGVVQNGVLCLDSNSDDDTLAQSISDNGELSADAEEKDRSDDFPIEVNSEFAAPLNISFGDKRRAILYMPIDATTEDAEYVKDMIALMFKRVYKVN